MQAIEELYDASQYSTSAEYVTKLALRMEKYTFHQHFHIIWPALVLLNATDYMEIGCYVGASLVTALQCPSLRRATAVDTFDSLPEQEKLVLTNIDREIGDREKPIVDMVKGSSHHIAVIIKIYRKLLQNTDCTGLDLLFIAGDHAYESVRLDFVNFYPLVKPNGIVMFDKYEDTKEFPGVKRFVDDLVGSSSLALNVIGQPENKANVFGNGLSNRMSNEFLVSKPALCLRQSKFVVCVATYERKDHSSAHKLKKFFTNLREQQFSDWTVIVVGDKYENVKEFDSFSQMFSDDEAYFVNLPVACERDDPVIQRNSRQLWCSGGCTAFNYALMLCSKFANSSIYVHADDDDVWKPNHLQALAEVYDKTNASFVWTQGVHTNGKTLPDTEYCQSKCLGKECGFLQLYPTSGQTLHSTVSWKISDIPLRYRIVHNYVTDADMWARITQYMKSHELKCYLNPTCTVHHVTEASNMK